MNIFELFICVKYFYRIAAAAQERTLQAEFFACGGSLQRHNSFPPQCDTARRAFLCHWNITE